MYQAIRDCRRPPRSTSTSPTTTAWPAAWAHSTGTKIVGTLKEIGYDGALTVEFVAPVDRTPANPYPNALETGPVELTAEELKFIEDHGSSTAARTSSTRGSSTRRSRRCARI